MLNVSEVDAASDHGYLYSRPKQAALLEVGPLFRLLLDKHCSPAMLAISHDSLPECIDVTMSALQCEGQFRKKMVFRPADLDSKHHKRLSQAVELHHVKVARVKKTVTTQVPAKAKVGYPHKGLLTRGQGLMH